MIVQYRLKLKEPEGRPLSNTWAYRLYAWLLEQAPEEFAAFAHRQENRCLSQYLDGNVWVLNLLGREAAEIFGAVLDKTEEISLNRALLHVDENCRHMVERPEDFLNRGRELHCLRSELRFRSPTAFRQAGRYAIYPETGLILQSLLAGWNQLYPEYLLEDGDMLAELKGGINIVDYSLRTVRFRLKDTAVPGCLGWATVEARLPIVLLELWNALLCFAQFSGLGIKTALGMGGVKTFSTAANCSFEL